MWYDLYKHGRVFVDNNINIYDKEMESAQILCSSIQDVDKRNRAVANVLAVEIAAKYFSSESLELDYETGLHNIAKILEDADIADLYINGNYIDVRVYFTDDELSVPKTHFDMGITPALYMFIKLNQDLSYGTVTGFIRPDFVNKDNLQNGYYYIDESVLSSYYDVESNLAETPDVSDFSNEKLYEFVEDSLNENDKVQLLRVLISSKTAREALIKIIKAQSVYNLISIPAEVPEESAVIESASDDSISEEDLDGLFEEEKQDEIEAENLFDSLEYSTETTPSGSDLIDNEDEDNSEENETAKTEEQIETLFTGEQEGVPVGKKKSSSWLITLLLAFLLAGSAGYLWYTRIAQQGENNFSNDNIQELNNEEIAPVIPEKAKEDAMPNETVNTVQNTDNNKEFGNAVEIPAIEQHLDASVLVSNLKVDWEVPAGYASNTSARRYLVKLGKIIQLNLKTELLLLTKPPISNRITVELKFDSGMNKFKVVGIKDSSGEKTVDNVILQTIKNALDLNISSNIETFGKLQGNPMLVIHL